MNVIEINRLTKKYFDFTLDNISMIIPTGTIMGLVGENGAGKSTLIRLIMNAAGKYNGSITVFGADNTDPAFSEKKEDIGIVLDEAFFPEALNAKQINSFFKHIYLRWDEECFNSYLQRFSLPEKKAFKEYSRGMKMKLSLAAALSHSPKLLILDEATSGLDPMVRDEMVDLFLEFTKDENHSILISSHIVSDLEKLCDYIAFLHKGKLLFCEEKDILLSEYGIIKTTAVDFEALSSDSVIGTKSTSYGMECLVRKNAVPVGFVFEYTSLEDIILFLAKEGKTL